MRTSGTLVKALRAINKILAASWLETLDGMSKFAQNVPSFSSGRNSDPRRDATPNASAKTVSAMITTVRRFCIAHDSTGAYSRLAVDTTRLSPCGNFLRSSQKANSGTSVSEKISEPTNAVVTLRAIG